MSREFQEFLRSFEWIQGCFMGFRGYQDIAGVFQWLPWGFRQHTCHVRVTAVQVLALYNNLVKLTCIQQKTCAVVTLIWHACRLGYYGYRAVLSGRSHWRLVDLRGVSADFLGLQGSQEQFRVFQGSFKGSQGRSKVCQSHFKRSQGVSGSEGYTWKSHEFFTETQGILGGLTWFHGYFRRSLGSFRLLERLWNPTTPVGTPLIGNLNPHSLETWNAPEMPWKFQVETPLKPPQSHWNILEIPVINFKCTLNPLQKRKLQKPSETHLKTTRITSETYQNARWSVPETPWNSLNFLEIPMKPQVAPFRGPWDPLESSVDGPEILVIPLIPQHPQKATEILWNIPWSSWALFFCSL